MCCSVKVEKTIKKNQVFGATKCGSHYYNLVNKTKKVFCDIYMDVYPQNKNSVVKAVVEICADPSDKWRSKGSIKNAVKQVGITKFALERRLHARRKICTRCTSAWRASNGFNAYFKFIIALPKEDCL